MNLFDMAAKENLKRRMPLAERMKPRTLEEFVGQKHIMSERSLLPLLIRTDRLTSVILYGPPGSGKTSIARIISEETDADFLTLNAVASGIKEIRDAIATAQNNLLHSRKTLLFIDEIHRFNKLQQDVLLPYIEDGTLILIGATTENPFFEVNNALLSRSKVFRLDALGEDELVSVLKNALQKEEGIASYGVKVSEEILYAIARMSSGDARQALNTLELCALMSMDMLSETEITCEVLDSVTQRKHILFDRAGDNHYDVASAFIKSIRGSDPDAALHYLAVMIEGGEDPKFIARRLLISASEDIGNADPMALVLANSGFQAVSALGMPEARISLAQVTTYLALAPKSNASYLAVDRAIEDVRTGQFGGVPPHLADGTGKRLRERYESDSEEKTASGRKAYLYPHDYEDGYVPQNYLPEEIADRRYYEPKQIGQEKKLAAYLHRTKLRRNHEIK